MPEPLDRETVAALVRDAAAAPSMHNAQPWRFRFLSGTSTFELRIDPERTLPHTDPTGRGTHLGCAAALFNLRVAATHAGWGPEHRLLPDPGQRHLLAAVRLAEPAGPPGELASLYPGIHRRHTSREPFEDRPVPETVRDALAHAARREGTQLVFPSAWHAGSLLDLVQDAERQEASDPAAKGEVARWVRTEEPAAGEPPTDGIPADALGPRRWDGRAPVRDFTAGRHAADRPSATFEATPQLALLGTAGDEPEDWLRAGQAMQRVLLVATLNGLATSLTSQALEWPDLRWSAREPVSAMGHVQMVFRLGFGPPGTPTPRRPVDEILDVQ
ncbi:Acg family FMN-binding oxidoreductase [Streptomyces sp. NPDC018031]|uniref:Acg family FMN-binding oxidoreductase n=1 Tax=Streptomyces sp. NPDC018031 TaxID=3365033 RepID=UPI0037889187